MKTKKQTVDKSMKRALAVHKVWHKFSKWVEKTFGKDLVQNKEMIVNKKKIKYKDINEWELSKKLTGYEAMKKIERYVKYNPEIKITYCDDDLYSSSFILLIPHINHGISVVFVPQGTGIQNRFFLYHNHWEYFIKELTKMGKKVYKNER
jgi:hypothetical protein